MGVTFCAVAAEHPLADFRARRTTPSWRHSSRNASAARRSKPNLPLKKKRACRPACIVRHPISGEPVPVWVGNYVLMSYGDGAVMGVPAHDERDFEFAKKYHLPIKPVIEWPGPRVFPGGMGALVLRAWPLRKFRAV